MPAKLIVVVDWEMQRDKEGHRDYEIDFLVKTDSYTEGPGWAVNAEGLPPIGSFWEIADDVDEWAIMTPVTTVKPVITKERGYYWIVGNQFSTRPIRRCQDSSIENPILEPYRISGSFITYSEEAWYDRFGRPFMSSSFEMYKGAEIEFDAGRPTVTIGFNSPEMPINVFSPIMHVVNDSWLWGQPPRTIKLSGVRWARQMYGTCDFFYSVDYDFEIKYDGWDKYIPDMGTRRLKTGGNPNLIKDFVAYVDNNNEPGPCFLNGAGVVPDNINQVKQWKFEKYRQANLLLLGIPSDLNSPY